MYGLERIAIMVPGFLFAITIHEFSHGYIAYRRGDPTAKMMGRLSLNPLVHLDILGSIMLVFVGFGWARPVPVNPYNLRDPKRDMIWVSFAGPAANLLSAFFFGLILRVYLGTGGGLDFQTPFVGVFLRMLIFAVQINIILAIFNMFPIPPLDGSKILFGLLPPQEESFYYRMERYGPLVLVGIIMGGYVFGVNIFAFIFLPFVRLFGYLFTGLPL